MLSTNIGRRLVLYLFGCCFIISRCWSWVDEKFGLDGPHIFFTSTTGIPTTYGLGITLAGSSTVTSATQTSSSTSAQTTTKSSASQTAAETSATTPTPTTESSGLSTGAKAGIGIAAAGGAVVLAAILGWFILSRRRKANALPKAGQEYPSQGSYMEQQYLQANPGPTKVNHYARGHDQGNYSPVHEADDTMVSYQYEMPANHLSHEMDTTSPRR